MFSVINRTVFDISSTWNRTRFEATRSQYRQARKLIEISINVNFERQLKTIRVKNLEIEKNITKINENLSQHEKEVNTFDHLVDIASESFTTHVDQRTKNIRQTIAQHLNAIQTIFQAENQYWKEMHRCVENISQLSVCRSTEIPSTYSQPNPPAQLCFSPTILHDEPSETMRTDLMKPRVIIHRISPSFLLHYLKKEDHHQQHSFALPEPMDQPRSRSRKRKRSISEDNDMKFTTTTLRERKSVSFIEIDEKKPRKRRTKKSKRKQIID